MDDIHARSKSLCGKIGNPLSTLNTRQSQTATGQIKNLSLRIAEIEIDGGKRQIVVYRIGK